MTYRKHTDGRVYFSYAQVHQNLCDLAERVEREFHPEVMLAIGGGGYIPARIMRTVLKIPILAVSLELYDDKTNTMREKVKKVQWLDEDTGDLKIRGKRVLIVDEVDDTRTTLMYCVEELLQSQNAPAAIAVAVVHNKLKKKHGKLPDNIDYFSGEDVEDIWNCYPWEAGEYGLAITEHEALARKCAGVRDDSSLGLPQINLLASFFAGAALYALFFTRK